MQKKDLHLVFIDLEKAFDRVPRDLMVCALRAHGVPETYVMVIVDMYKDVKTKIRCTSGTSEEFPIEVGVHQGSVCSPLLFNITMNYLTESLMDDLLLTMLFADDIALVSDDVSSLQHALNKWKEALESNGLRISRSKTEYLHCPFSDTDAPTPDLYLDGHMLQTCDRFKYLGSVMQKEGTCDADLNHRVSTGWMKWQQNSAIFCDKKMPPKLKGRLYNTVVRPALIYGTECWTMNKNLEHKITTTENKMLRMTAGVTLMDRLKTNHIRGSLRIRQPILETVQDKRHRWYGHVKRRDDSHLVLQAINEDVPVVRSRGRPRETWIGQMRRYQERHGITDEEIQDRTAYRNRLRPRRR